MKLVLANNQTDRFVQFHNDIQQDEKLYDYSDYRSLLFYFEKGLANAVDIHSGKAIDSYDGVYINGYLATPEIAYALATTLDYNGVPYVNREIKNAPSLTKLTAYAKLATCDVDIPKTFAGTTFALKAALRAGRLESFPLPVVLKRADAERGIDNFIFDSYDSVTSTLDDSDELAVWLIQEFIPNDGFYLLNFNYDELNFGIFRSMGQRADNRKELAHMFKPLGGKNARYIEPADVPPAIVKESLKAITAMNRQLASVDSIYNPQTGRVSILEVNYNPQFVTVSSFSEQRRSAFLKAIKTIE